MDYRYPVDHMGMGKQRNTAHIRNEQYRQKIFRYRAEQSIHRIFFMNLQRYSF